MRKFKVRIGKRLVWYPAIFLENLFCFACFIFTAWVLLSWFNIICNNMSPNPVYWDWNFWTMMIDRLA